MMYFEPQIRSAARMHTYIRDNKTTVVQYGVRNSMLHPCGGGVEYLHCDPASRKRRRNGTKKGRAIA
jgi:hypothetical protein